MTREEVEGEGVEGEGISEVKKSCRECVVSDISSTALCLLVS